MISLLKVHPLLKIARGAIYELPTPTNIRAIWNFGSLLGLCLIIQILTGLFLAMHYCGDISLAFYRVNHISRDVNYGWLYSCAKEKCVNVLDVKYILTGKEILISIETSI